MSLTFVPVPAFKQMGLVLGFGVAVSLLLAMTLTPILFSLLKTPKTSTYDASWTQKLLTGLLFKVEKYMFKIPWRVVVLFVLFFGYSIYGLTHLVIETDLNKRFDEQPDTFGRDVL